MVAICENLCHEKCSFSLNMKFLFIFMFLVLSQVPILNLSFEVHCILACLSYFQRYIVSLVFCVLCLLVGFLFLEKLQVLSQELVFASLHAKASSSLTFHFHFHVTTLHLSLNEMRLHVFHLIYHPHMHVIPFSTSVFTHLTLHFHSHDTITPNVLRVIASKRSDFD